MERVLGALAPRDVFYYFEELSGIPRGSGNEKAVSDYIAGLAKSRGLAVEQDTYNNLIIRKPASPGCEDAPVVMLQNHMDMVCEKVPESDLDFEQDGLRLAIDEQKGTIYAKGTSLGADNGVGLAVALAIMMDDDLVHPPLEIVCTVSEEAGLAGAVQMDMSSLRAKYMINSDSYRFDMVQAGCAGCAYLINELPIQWTDPDELDQGAELTIGGLLGGHSGLDVCRQRTNANKLMGRFLDTLRQAKIPFSLADYRCFNKDNAIPRDAACVFALRAADKGRTAQTVTDLFEAVKAELAVTDPGVTCSLRWVERPSRCLTGWDTDTAVRYLMLVPDGLFQKYHAYDDPDLGESSANLGRIILEEDRLVFRSMVRANYLSRKEEVIRKLELLGDLLGMLHHRASDAPPWPFDPESPLLHLLLRCYREMTGREMEVSVAHGTCECGLFKDRVGCETVSIGADIRYLHSPLEEVDIASGGKLYELNIRMLAALAGREGI